ncbi:MAG: hypothetical protein AAF578_02265 [Pseudomonadota bacterium]
MVRHLTVVALSMILAAQAQAQAKTSEGLDGLTKCRAIEDPAKRVACYDALAGDEAPPAESPAAPEPAPEAEAMPLPEEPIVEASLDASSAGIPAPEEAAVEPQPVPAAPQTANSSDESEDLVERFGLEQVETANADELESRLVGDYDGWWGNTIFRLENGQVWQQTQPGRWRHQGPPNPKVTIRRRAFSSYRLKVEGSNRTIRVKRIE